MNSNLQYNGKVTIKFYNKDGKLKGTHIQYNHGTPYLFSVIEKVLAKGTNTLNDDRPGRIMLTSPGYIIKSSNVPYTLTIVNGKIEEVNDEVYYSLDGDSALAQLAYNVPKVAAYIYEDDLVDYNDTIIPDYKPCIRYEFNISYYDLLRSLVSKVGSLDRYRLWLLSSNETSFNIGNKIVSIPSGNTVPDISDIDALGGYTLVLDVDTMFSTDFLPESQADIDTGVYYIKEGSDPNYVYTLATSYVSGISYYMFNTHNYYTRSGSDPNYVYTLATNYVNGTDYWVAMKGVSEANEDKLMECLLNNITYNNVNTLSKICALTQIKKQENEVDYTLNEGEYITVLWDMYFQNNPVSEVNE